MKKNWKNVLLYIVRIIELLITGAAGGALGSGLCRTVSLIIVHCSANKAGSALRAEDIDRYHRSLGWKCCGYHYVIPTDGTIEAGRPEELVGAHCKHHNSHSIGICYIGGLDDGGTTPKDTRTEAQKATLRKLIEQLHQRYPKALIVGHHDLNPQKACPCFHVTAEYIDLQP